MDIFPALPGKFNRKSVEVPGRNFGFRISDHYCPVIDF
jgi:hypothetical protein